MKVEEEKAGVEKLDPANYRRPCQDQEDCRSIHIGLSVPSYPQRKRDQKGCLPSFQKVHWGLHLDKPQSELTGAGSRGSSRDGCVDHVNRTRSPAAEQLQNILGEEDEAPNPTLFTEMDTLQHDGDQMEWKESARWIKFEEKVEEGGERWSKPHVSTLSLHSLFELRTFLQTGTVLLDLDSGSLPQIIDDVIEKQIEDGLLRPELRERVSYVLLRKHRHQTKKPIHRSLVDIGKSVSSTTNRSPARSPTAGPSLHRSTEDLRMRQSANYGRLCHAQSRSMNDISRTPNTDQRKNKFMKKIPKDSEASNVLVGEVDFLDQPFIAFVRLIQSAMLGGVTEVPVPTRFLFILLGPSGRAKSYNEIGRAIATLMVDDLFSDVAYKARNREDLIAGIDEFLDEVIVLPPGEWDPNIRIEPPKKVPSADKRKSVFSLMELGQMNGSVGGGSGANAGGGTGGSGGGGGGTSGGSSGDDGEMPAVHEIGEELIWTGRFFGGLCLDVKRKLPWFPSDFYDGFHIQSISAILFIYLGCITNAITFGGLLGDATDNYQGVMESFLGTSMAGSLFCLFSGQPLIILSSTGPILIFEKLLFDFSKGNGLDYMEFRLWIGLHSAIQCLILVATDASFIIKYVTRFTEEGFSTLISFIFIYDAIKKMIGAFKYYPINMDFKPDSITTYKCECVAPDTANITTFNASVLLTQYTNTSLYNPLNLTALDWSLLSKKECLNYGGRLLGNSCQFIPDLALMSFILFFGTYSMTLALKKFKFSRYFPTKVRALVADFSIVFSILLFCGIDACFGLETPKLHVPSVIKPTRPDRGWFVAPFGKNPWWVYLASILPALLVTILIFMDQQITAVIVNRKENKLRKAAGYHLDLFWVGILMALCSFMGLPWYVAATVISIAHIDSLKMETETSAPGEQPQFLGVREQRVTGTIVFILTGISVFLAPILKFIPLPVLYGVFLYMGVASLNGIQFWERCKLFLMPAKHQPDHAFLRHVPLRRIHLFTLVQILCLAVLWILKSTMAAIIFPVMILGLIIVRRLLDLVFSQHDLAWIDNVLPEKEKKETDKKKKRRRGAQEDSDEEPQFPPPSVIKIPMESVQSDPQNGIHCIARKRSSSWSYSL
ncbi:electrogenic sodium bicarbonate cotransporter 4 isoform X1 [Talpa occidentalis]|uniref:electrogenic sodium bicarbonate cotransporter 4 isoform X1 n=1 Tax=Talpa occidentalis TaxID=50954 RepID=UPI00188E5B77|nr:electrogenic sodium bicarbonate cotransporter 4 isoform X1 [Talpa occidentalis]XP_037383558.1 electrogenic sodium bicarbonate cotransporter 4 isoform X1 [Talpa occidentalis]XP_054557718.1 electrogenic sodium bicarbonate cotransporter 4 isoform X1 [Talpa occidentalis]XP_054557719.1 electrogenic sodium bicarbonate cotransporter 4 isoform X1 [Talpa occidentalis]